MGVLRRGWEGAEGIGMGMGGFMLAALVVAGVAVLWAVLGSRGLEEVVGSWRWLREVMGWVGGLDTPSRHWYP